MNRCEAKMVVLVVNSFRESIEVEKGAVVIKETKRLKNKNKSAPYLALDARALSGLCYLLQTNAAYKRLFVVAWRCFPTVIIDVTWLPEASVGLKS